ncbi:MAG: hypothetical protein FD153_601 [Rhodospirillaceae bacterium]|nr:MAG: hypothetical protein FD153_601 [Rhodospirillaceae bacterium]
MLKLVMRTIGLLLLLSIGQRVENCFRAGTVSAITLGPMAREKGRDCSRGTARNFSMRKKKDGKITFACHTRRIVHGSCCAAYPMNGMVNILGNQTLRPGQTGESG